MKIPYFDQSDSEIYLYRTYKDDCTLSTMQFPSGTSFACIELPNKDNKQDVSCIPEGQYILRKRESAIVNRTTKGRHKLGWWVTTVKGRSLIMIHIANTVNDLLGCIGIGKTHGKLNKLDAVLQSVVGFEEFMKEMESREWWNLIIVEDK